MFWNLFGLEHKQPKGSVCQSKKLSRSRPSKVIRLAGLESLESRLAPAVEAFIAPGGELLVLGDNNPNTINIQHDATGVTLVNQFRFQDSSFRFITIRAGQNDDIVNIHSGVHTVDMDLGAGNNQVNLGNNQIGAILIPNMVNISRSAGTPGSVRLNYNDCQCDIPTTYNLSTAGTTGTLIQIPAVGPVKVVNFSVVTTSLVELFTGRNADIVNVLSTSSSVITRIHNCGRIDRVNVGNAFNGMQSILGRVEDMGPTTILNLNDSGNSTTRTATHSISGTTGTVSGLAPAAVTYATPGILEVNLTTGSGSDVVNVSQTGLINWLVLDSSGGLDSVIVGTTMSGIQQILSPVFVNNSVATTTLTINNCADPMGRTGFLTSYGPWVELWGMSPATINFAQSQMNSVTLMTGTGVDQLFIHSLVTVTLFVVDCGGPDLPPIPF